MQIAPKYITVVALCGVEQAGDMVRINRKFHTGMLEYIRRLPLPLGCVLPELRAGESGDIDMIETPRGELPYAVWTVSDVEPTGEDLPRLAAAVEKSALVYCGTGRGLNQEIARLCRARGVPYVATTEYTRRTELDIMRAETASLPRRLLRTGKIIRNYRRKRELIVAASEVHANGYPTYLENEGFGVRQILFFDSRMAAADVIDNGVLEQRLEGLRAGRVPRLLYSGRYHPMKGALGVVLAGIELRRRSVRFQLDLFGAGPLKAEMLAAVAGASAGDAIRVNDPVPFSPDLIAITRECDLFLCAHKQGDPSCTYLETFGAGVPIVGYANEMWSPLCAASGGGVVVRARPEAMADGAASLLADPARLTECSQRARQFVAEHVMEKMWDLRCDRLRALLPADNRAQPASVLSSPATR